MRYEIRDISPPAGVRSAMELQVTLHCSKSRQACSFCVCVCVYVCVCAKPLEATTDSTMLLHTNYQQLRSTHKGTEQGYDGLQSMAH